MVALVAMASVAYGVVLVARAREFLAHHRTTGGVVTAVSSNTLCGSPPVYGCTTSYDWTVRYQPPGSGSLTFTDGGNNNSIPVGTHVLVYYLDRDQGVAMLDSGTGEQSDGIILIAVGLAVFALDYLEYRGQVRRGARGRAGWPASGSARRG